MAFEDKAEAECRAMLRLFFLIADSNIGKIPSDERHHLAESMAKKFLDHAFSVLHLREGTLDPIDNFNFVDASSIHVLLRAALETSLVFSHLYDKNTPESTLKMRFESWKLCDLLTRQKFPNLSPEYEKYFQSERIDIHTLRTSLLQNSAFKILTKKQQDRILDGSAWRTSGWQHIALNMGLNRTHAKAFYSYLCSYSHTGFLSVIQVHRARTRGHQLMLSGASMFLLTICIAHMIRMYCDLFPESKPILLSDSAGNSLVDMWVGIGAADLSTPASPQHE
jgi:hypothetical protein